jgi:hypothetical protein
LFSNYGLGLTGIEYSFYRKDYQKYNRKSGNASDLDSIVPFFFNGVGQGLFVDFR